MSEREIEAHRTSQGARIYRLPLDLFPGLKGYAHLVCRNRATILVDVGSGFGDSNDQLEAGLASVQRQYGEASSWKDLTHILISHGHIDHFGGLGFVRSRCSAPLGVHSLDRRVLIAYEERLKVIAHRLREFLIEAGVSQDGQDSLMGMYLLNKHLFQSMPVDFTIEEDRRSIDDLKIYHVPGHCPGQIVIQIDDVLLSGDHILEKTSPHQAPEQLTLNTGLGHYLESLEKTRKLSKDIQLTIGGHEGPIINLEERIREIESLHEERLAQVLTLLKEPKTIAEVSHELFPEARDYHELLALEETGAHVEYLILRGYLMIANIEDLRTESCIPILYQQREGAEPPKIVPGISARRVQ
jgi:glyoxylase-like metal-dependent hydrolase (beta-lactamase superfamily II)